MKREIEFRAKRLNGRKQFIYGMLHEDLDGLMITETVDERSAYAHTVVDPKTVGEYTGLKDKNGKKIYENDIIKTETDKPMIVSWNNYFASFYLNRDGWAFSHWFGEAVDPERCEVIGNIHDNLELLKQRQND